MFPHHGRSYTSGLTWQDGKAPLEEKILLQNLQHPLDDQLNTLEKDVIDDGRKYKEIYTKSQVAESEPMTIAQFKSGLKY